MSHNCLVLCFFGILVCFASLSVARVAIIGGEKAKEHQFPYQVLVQVHVHSKYSFTCGGGIIGNHFILTAAHCVLDENGELNDKRMTVHAGTNDKRQVSEPTVICDVVKIYVSKDFRLTKNSFGDIAVLKLKQPLEPAHHSHLQHLQLPEKNEKFVGKTATIAGFGWDWIKFDKGQKEKGGNSDTQLRFAETTVISNRVCQVFYTGLKLLEKHICAKVKPHGNAKPRGVCVGDSGGPLVLDGKTVIGVMSKSSTTCIEEEKAAIYTDVSNYIDFIHDAIHDRHNDNTAVLELDHHIRH